ncbi:glycosyltransferase WbsX family protein [Achromobacter denitrificans]|uniref:Glycoside hydrolase family 99-like domain-containing protein n=1 Tax=Achromobacter denitrificans TaxID=32002 RepID=A0ABZ3G2C8_ACHDE|nr:glycosyl hydrolase [Achromobacter denitrificans]
MKKNSASLGTASFQALSGLREYSEADDAGYIEDTSKLIAFYLPQYHRVAENSEWWGPGFTEWTNVARGRPNFEGHYQPHIPRELGFYDLDRVEIIREQAALAREYGIHGFCFYYYWFSGRRILERPLDRFLESDIDMPFCLCWANENWTRTWDGDTKSVLLEQKYSDGDEERFIQDIYPFLSDPRYISVDGKPLLVVYRIKELPQPKVSIKKWKKEAERLGLPGLHVSVVDFYDISDPREVGADAMVEFPPHKFNGPQNRPDPEPAFSNPNFRGGLVDYARVVAQSMLRPKPSFILYRGIIPSWDNTARRQDTGTIIVNATPSLFGSWLRYLRTYTREVRPNASDPLIFVNAWNEWGEGCHLEPDIQWGLGYLDEVARSSHVAPEDQVSINLAREAAFTRMDQIAARDGIKLKANLNKHKPMNPGVLRIAHMLRKVPILHTIARHVYRAIHTILR